MKLRKSLICFIIFFLIMSISTSCFAFSFKTKNKEEVVNSDIYSAGENAIEYKNIKVNGNMFLASEKVTLNNVKVDGDVVVFGNEIDIVNCEIKGNLWSAGNTITVLSSEIVSAYAAGDTLVFDDNTEITRELRIAGDSIKINAEVERDVYVGGNNVEFGKDASVFGKTVVKADKNIVSDEANIEDLDYERVKVVNEFNNTTLELLNSENLEMAYLAGKGAEIVIILLIALFVLNCFPKFTEVNSVLRLRDFFKAFFTGLLEIIIILFIVVLLFCTIIGIRYGFILLNLLISFILLGKVIFILSFAIRISCAPEKISKMRAFLSVGIVALVLYVIQVISYFGIVGFGFVFVLNAILAITGFGSMFRVLFTSKKKINELASKKVKVKTSNVVDNSVIKETSNEVKEAVSNSDLKENVQKELNEEIKAEVKEEIEELKKEREEDNLNNNENKE